ncbi:L-threonylcarbamoyladenylate synthase [Desulfovibrio mangrovi]|uniref:L-threonylcarbamoyladenylate synthase n=1 Tax=Desulfovibrio mangrovi TaxID=2976983 RepID=UPI0022475DA4|nr:L-threonylcarbamoyladenylate synthase [Desulfovibrio mangrovi]UZP67809.1 L-threonylcarbamoyladenylate synthase [Desulfovibrio mangrovi]
MPTATGLPERLDMEAAVRQLKNGEVVCYPTETFFAVGCSAFDVYAIERVFQAKKRSGSMPLPVIVGSREQLSMITDVQSDIVRALADAFWPGSLSILVTASAAVPAILTGETGRVAVRLSPHPVARELCLSAGVPLVSTSANISGRPATTEADRLDDELVAATGGVLDLPPAPGGGKASTLVEIAGPDAVRIVRQGPVTEDDLQAAGFMVHS